MPKSKRTRVSIRSQKPALAKVEGFLSQIKWGESYTSLFLGAVVVVVAIVLVFSFLKSRNIINTGQTDSTSTVSKEAAKELPKTYAVKEGDHLWAIAEKIYGSGYNWVDLASANKLENPSVLYVGTKLVVPNVAAKTITIQKTPEISNPITGNSYTVVEGDSLWDITVRAYGDGYKWTEVAKINNLANPDLIYSGNVLKLPR